MLYPATATTKAEVIAYYVEIAPFLLPHVAGRPVTRKRWVEGVGTVERQAEVFFEKNLPTSAPQWIPRISITHRTRSNTYPLFTETAALAWAGQVAALELHVPQWQVDQAGTPQNPDRLVLDLDPGPGAGLAECVEVAHAARELLDEIGLEAVPVTSGSKGIHLYAGLSGEHDADYVNGFARQLAKALENELPDLVVSTQQKSLRAGKVLVDWSQNNANKTTIAPYSLRGVEHPGVACPREWDELDDSLTHLMLDEVLERMRERDDPLAALGVHEQKHDRLDLYRSKRDGSKTPEPVPETTPGDRGEQTFVIQEHHASRLHYDLRLEHDGVLVSWAIPKGVPTDPSTNHLAVQTEDHPLEYATFEGTIPAGEYGAGEMTIWDSGTYELEKWRDSEVIATLTGQPGGRLGEPRRYALIKTGENWLIHLMEPRKNASPQPAPKPAAAPLKPSFVSPMLASAGTLADIGSETNWTFEMKWDGIRCVAVIDGGVKLFTRNANNVTASYPEIVEALNGLELDGVVLDGEIVALNDHGVPEFGRLQHRMGVSKPAEVRRVMADVPATFLVFDLLHAEGISLLRRSTVERREALELLDPDDGSTVMVPQAFTGSLTSAVASSRALGLEGVLAKRRDARYAPERRSKSWIKIKHIRMQEVVIGGWRPGNGSLASTFGSLLLGVPDDDGLRYVGRVGTGFTERMRRTIFDGLKGLESTESPFTSTPRDVATDARWVSPTLVAEVAYGEWTQSGHLRHPTWRGMRPDKSPSDVHIE